MLLAVSVNPQTPTREFQDYGFTGSSVSAIHLASEHLTLSILCSQQACSPLDLKTTNSAPLQSIFTIVSESDMIKLFSQHNLCVFYVIQVFALSELLHPAINPGN